MTASFDSTDACSPEGALTIEGLDFSNRFTRSLPADPSSDNRPRQVRGAGFSRVKPTPVSQPQLVAHAREVAQLLDFSEDFCHSPEFAQIFSGSRLAAGMDPHAMCYGGHQFGNWAGQLGDGRAINLGELVNKRGEHWTLQLKGAGLTPYSRTADGLAVLRSSVREFLCSEAMYHLGVPTTRALSLVTTGEDVLRDMFYDGHPRHEPGAVVCRVAQSFLRFGSFEIFAAREENEVLRQLADFTIRNDFPHLGEPAPEVYIAWFEEVCRITAEMIVHWMRVGFVHGVMNTDNMSILGLTIDYGPYGWLEDYDPGWTPNTTDASGRRYCFGNQPRIAMWNLAQLGSAIHPLVGEIEPLQDALNSYSRYFEAGWQAMMAAKLGFEDFRAETDEELVSELLAVLQLVETDMTIFFRKLATFSGQPQTDSDESDEALMAPVIDAYYEPDKINAEQRSQIAAWFRDYRARLGQDAMSDTLRREKMNAVNPKYVLRNYLAQLAIDKAEQGDNTLVSELLELLRQPYDEQLDQEQYAAKRPDWARERAGCSMLSCSS